MNESRTMKLNFDKQADALYLRLDDSKILESEEVAPGIVLDFNENNEVVGVEILGISKRTVGSATDLVELTGLVPAWWGIGLRNDAPLHFSALQMPFRVIRSLGRGEKCSGKWVGQAVAILEVKHCDDSRAWGLLWSESKV